MEPRQEGGAFGYAGILGIAVVMVLAGDGVAAGGGEQGELDWDAIDLYRHIYFLSSLRINPNRP